MYASLSLSLSLFSAPIWLNVPPPSLFFFFTVCCAMWCPCFVFGKIKTRMKPIRQGRVHSEKGGSGCSCPCFWYCVCLSCTGMTWVLQARPVFRSRRAPSDIVGLIYLSIFSFTGCLAHGDPHPISPPGSRVQGFPRVVLLPDVRSYAAASPSRV